MKGRRAMHGCKVWYCRMTVALLLVAIAGCDEDAPPVAFRSDFVPLKVVMTDYIIDGDEKLFKIQGSAQLIVPLAGCEPVQDGNCFRYLALPKPVVDSLSVRIDNQVLLQNDRGFFTSRNADSKRINELRAEAARKMQNIAGSEPHVQQAMKITRDALRQFYEKFGCSCSLQWR